MGWFGSLSSRRTAEDELLDEARMPFGVGMPQEAKTSVAPSTAAGAAVGALPGSGIADVMGYLPNFEGGTYPSFGQNIKAGHYGQAGMQTLGLAGDVAMAAGAIPFGMGLKEIVASAKPAAKEAGTVAKELEALKGKPDVTAAETANIAHGAGPEGVGGVGSGGAQAAHPGGIGGGEDRVGAAQISAERAAGRYAPLPGLPRSPLEVGDRLYIPGPIATAKDVAERYMQDMKLKPSYHLPPDRYHKLDEEHAKAIAQAYEDMEHVPDHPAVKASYDAMAKETLAQYRYIRRHHPELVIEANAPGVDPYAATPRLAARDVGENNRLSFFPTEQGFGTGEQGGIDLSKHPMMQPSGETLNGKPLLYNDLFRIVHDYFGHLAEGNGFRAAGEDMAWRLHAPMYSDLARPAMTSETRGQNSWVNFGPFAEQNKGASGANTIYAPQKVGLMPEWTMRDRGSLEPITTYRGGPHGHEMVDMSKIGTGEGSGVRGHGMYSAEAEAIARRYRYMTAATSDPLLKKYGLTDFEGNNMGRDLADTLGDHKPVVKTLQDYVDGLKAKQAEGDTSAMTVNNIKRSENMIRYLNDPKRAQGHLYQLAIDRPEEQFMHWDKLLSEQTDYVKKKLAPVLEQLSGPMNKSRAILAEKARQKLAGNPSEIMRQKYQADLDRFSGPVNFENWTGEKIYEAAAQAARGKMPVSREEGYPISSEYLRAKGISGIKYRAGKNFGVPAGAEGTHNYVSFYPERILKRYAIPGMLGGAGLTASILSRRGEQDDGT